MTPYQLARGAAYDLKSIALGTRRRSGEPAAEALLARITTGFDLLASSPGVGHRRQDLTSRPYFFYNIKPYLIVYVRDVDPLLILAVLHGSRDVRRLLLRR